MHPEVVDFQGMRFPKDMTALFLPLDVGKDNMYRVRIGSRGSMP